VSFDRVDVKISGTTVLHALNWQLFDGTHWGILGENGSGKSSLLGLIAGMLWPAPDKGNRRYDFGNGVLRDAVEAKRRITLVGPELQNRYTRWSWNFSAIDVVLSGLYRTDVPRKRPNSAEKIRAETLMRELGLARLAERPFLELSRGEQRRVLIARSFAFKPSILLLDEPASGLDERSRAALDDMIDHISQNTIVVSSSHEEADLPSITTDVLELRSGRIVSSGPHRAAVRPSTDNSRSTERAGAPRSNDPSLKAKQAPLIAIDHVDVWLGGRRVLHDICWQLRDAEQWLITGANGAGKSSFLRLLHGQLRPARGGTIRWPALGDPRNIWSLRKQVAYVSPELQAAYLFPSTVLACVASGFESSIGQTRRMSADEARRIDELLERFQLSEFSARQLTSLSYGQFRRVLIARSLINNPRILLLDEPWEGLDQPTRELIQTQFAALVAQGTQLVCVSHRPDLGTVFTHELVLERGRISQIAHRRISHGDAGAARRENSASAPRREADYRRH